MKFWQRRREEKLYRQWAEHAELPPGAIPQREIPKDMTIKGEEKGRVYLFKVKILNFVKRILRVE